MIHATVVYLFVVVFIVAVEKNVFVSFESLVKHDICQVLNLSPKIVEM